MLSLCLFKENEVTQSYLTLCDHMDYSLPDSSIDVIFQARVLEWVTISFSRGSSQPRDWTWVSHIAGRRFTIWAIREARGCVTLLLGRKAMKSLDRLLKSKDITFLTKVHIVKAVVFPVVMYRCESWKINKTERQRIDAFELRCWRRLLRIPWTARRSDQSMLKEINPEYSLEGLMLKLKVQSFGHLMWRADSLEKTLMLGKIEGRRRRGRQRLRWLDGITYTQWTRVWANLGR